MSVEMCHGTETGMELFRLKMLKFEDYLLEQ